MIFLNDGFDLESRVAKVKQIVETKDRWDMSRSEKGPTRSAEDGRPTGRLSAGPIAVKASTEAPVVLGRGLHVSWGFDRKEVDND